MLHSEITIIMRSSQQMLNELANPVSYLNKQIDIHFVSEIIVINVKRIATVNKQFIAETQCHRVSLIHSASEIMIIAILKM